MNVPIRISSSCSLIAIAMLGLAQPASADVITDWNDRAVAHVIGRSLPPPPAERIIAMTHIAMFDAVNSIERRYQPYLVQMTAGAEISKEAAAAAAAGTVLARIHPPAQADMQAALSAYLATMPDGAAKAEGIRLGEAVATKVLEARVNDGTSAPDTYRPAAQAGVYVPTAPTMAPQWPNLKPFALAAASQFRPAAPLALTSPQWAADYNEIKELGARNSTKRTARQTEDAKFWIASSANIYYPIVRALYDAKKPNLLDGARIYALMAAARSDALLAVLDAKYQYNFWRPVTAIRNGDNDNNPATERDAAWLPLGDTPMHPEYPCAHCVLASSMSGVVETLFGTVEVAEISTTSPSLPNVTHRWTSMRALENEVAEARIFAGFHYRSSTRVGQELGRKVGAHTVNSVMQPVGLPTR